MLNKGGNLEPCAPCTQHTRIECVCCVLRVVSQYPLWLCVVTLCVFYRSYRIVNTVPACLIRYDLVMSYFSLRKLRARLALRVLSKCILSVQNGIITCCRSIGTHSSLEINVIFLRQLDYVQTCKRSQKTEVLVVE